MRKFAPLVLITILSAASSLAVDGKKAKYVGGTVSAILEKAEGQLTTNLEDKIVFTHEKGVWEVPYSQITGLEYGQKAGRRVGVAIVVSPLTLFSKKRDHFLTINFTDSEGKMQAVVFEIGKDIVRTTLTILETRSGKKIEYQDEETRKAMDWGLRKWRRIPPRGALYERVVLPTLHRS